MSAVSTATVNLVTAVMGSGKTLYIVKLIDSFLTSKVKDGEIEPAPLIYTNIEGLVKEKFKCPDNIHIFDAPMQQGVDPFDWRDCPEGSIVIYDEAQYFFPASGKRGVDVPAYLTDLTMARHLGITLYFITQDASQLHHQIRNVIGRHIHLYRAFGASISTVYTWQHFCKDPNSRVEQTRAIKELFKFPRKYFDYYKSAQVHTHKFKVPRKIVALISLMILIGFASIYTITKNKGLKTFKTDVQNVNGYDETDAFVNAANVNGYDVVKDGVTSSNGFAWTNAATVTDVSGCVVNSKRGYCHCYNSDGSVLDLSYGQCLSVIDKPLPFNIRSSFIYSSEKTVSQD